MKYVTLVLLVAVCSPICAQTALKKGSKIYIEKMPNDLDSYIVAEMFQKKVPLEVVTDSELADYIMLGSGTEEQNRKWHQGWLTAEQDRTSGNIRILEISTKKLLFAGEAGDRSLWWGALSRGGQRKVASRLVSKIKENVK